MAAATGGRLLGGVFTAYRRSIGCAPQAGVLLQVRGYAARKGTREKARKSKVKVEVKKVGFIPHNQREKFTDAAKLVSKRTDDTWKPANIDNVWVAKYYRWRVYSFAEAVQCFKESHHPTMLDLPKAPIVAYIELNMQGAKKTRFVERFTRTVDVPYPFPQQVERNVLVLCKGDDLQTLATDAGATVAGGGEIIKQVMAGEVSFNDFNVIIAHPNILPELVAVRGLMKKRFPNVRDGTLDPDVAGAVKKFLDGVEYKATRDEREQDFGTINAPIGTVDMDTKELEENFVALLKDINQKAPKRPGSFITKTLLLCAPSIEKLKLDYEQYIVSSSTDKKDEDDDGDDDEDDQPQAAASSN